MKNIGVPFLAILLISQSAMAGTATRPGWGPSKADAISDAKETLHMAADADCKNGWSEVGGYTVKEAKQMHNGDWVAYVTLNWVCN